MFDFDYKNEIEYELAKEQAIIESVFTGLGVQFEKLSMDHNYRLLQINCDAIIEKCSDDVVDKKYITEAMDLKESMKELWHRFAELIKRIWQKILDRNKHRSRYMLAKIPDERKNDIVQLDFRLEDFATRCKKYTDELKSIVDNPMNRTTFLQRISTRQMPKTLVYGNFGIRKVGGDTYTLQYLVTMLDKFVGPLEEDIEYILDKAGDLDNEKDQAFVKDVIELITSSISYVDRSIALVVQKSLQEEYNNASLKNDLERLKLIYDKNLYQNKINNEFPKKWWEKIMHS